MPKCKDCGVKWAQEMGLCRACQAKRIGAAPQTRRVGRKPQRGRTLAEAKTAMQHKHCKQCGLGLEEYMACDLPDCGPLE